MRIDDGHTGEGGERTCGVPGSDGLPEHAPQGIDTTIPHPARIYDFLLGGKTNFAVDRAAAARVVAAVPDLPTSARLNLLFLRRGVRYAARRGIRQFPDIGTGIPSAGNTHESAHEIAPDAGVAYVDNDPIVLLHARAPVADDGRGTTSFTPADLRDPEATLADPRVRAVIRQALTPPVAVRHEAARVAQ